MKTLVWNGPFGAFELEPFDNGTVEVAEAVAELTEAGKLVSVAGGGDTVAALNAAGVTERFSYVSTAGGAFLEWLEGKALPGVEALRDDSRLTSWMTMNIGTDPIPPLPRRERRQNQQV